MRHWQPLPLVPTILALEQYFGTRLVGIVGYGSYFGTRSQSAHDIDLVIALDRSADDDLRAIGVALGKRIVDLPVQVQVLSLERSGTSDLYSINTCGPFFLEVLREATILSGTNPFCSWPRPRREVTDLSLLQKMQQYVYELQNRYFNLQPTTATSEEWRLVMKRLRLLDDDATRLLGSSWPKATECKALRTFLRTNTAREGQPLLPVRLEKAITLSQSALELARAAVYERLTSR